MKSFKEKALMLLKSKLHNLSCGESGMRNIILDVEQLNSRKKIIEILIDKYPDSLYWLSHNMNVAEKIFSKQEIKGGIDDVLKSVKDKPKRNSMDFMIKRKFNILKRTHFYKGE